MVQIEMYAQTVTIFWGLLIFGVKCSAIWQATILGTNKIGTYCGIEPQDPALIRELGERWLDKITAPVSRKTATPNLTTRVDHVLHAVVVAAITVTFTTLFQLLTIPAAAGASIASSHLLGDTFSVTTVSLHLVAISMLLALGLFTHINGRIQEGMRYA
ncbi:hypothetical protein HYG81_19365 (plasmid) [Natrinema zhouii]|uniref:hypothetical protein n=1 Tax=Natrinema zhouii TaxID=1710539 RepID=UPI001CFF55E5|nr:hypothetical protein [Natrinema zhouii]UHQ98245.1 hypothetical protein HYG81_19365 [Natrinema zhouii]